MFKKFLATALALTTFTVMGTFSASAASSKGDVDNSGTIDIKDASTLLNHINGVKSLNSSALSAADVDSNGIVDIGDVSAIINHINGVKPIGGSSSSSGRKLDALRKKYAGNYCLKTKDSNYPNYTYEYDFKGNNYYVGNFIDGSMGYYEVRATDGMTYLVNPDDKLYYADNFSFMPNNVDIIGGFADEYIKTVTNGNIVSEYYTPVDHVFVAGGQIIYHFDKNTSALKSVECKPDDPKQDLAYTQVVISIGTANTSRFAVPNLKGYTKLD